MAKSDVRIDFGRRFESCRGVWGEKKTDLIYAGKCGVRDFAGLFLVKMELI